MNVVEAVETAVSPTVALAAAVPEAVSEQVRDVPVVLPEPLPDEVTRFELYEALEATAEAVEEESADTGEVFTVQDQEYGVAVEEVPLYETEPHDMDTAYVLY